MGTQIDGKSVKITSISWKWKPWAHWAAFASSVCAGNAKRRRPASRFFIFLSPLGRFWAPFWTQLDPKGGPKIMFLGIMLEKWWKKGVRKRDPKKHQKLIEICSQNERVWEVKMSVSLEICCKIKVFGELWNIEKIGAKRGPKNDQNRSQKRSEIRFLRFLEVLGGAEI